MYYTEAEENGQVAVWAGLSPENPELDINREFIGWADSAESAQKLINRLRQADRLDGAYGESIWGVDDIVAEFGVTRAEAEEYLAKIDGRLRDGQNDRGWEIIRFWVEEMPDARTPAERQEWERLKEEA